MKKTILVFTILLFLMFNIVFATCQNADNYFDSLTNFCQDPNNNFCDDGEIIIIHKDCELDLKELTVFEQAWFYKLLVILFLLFMFKHKSILRDKNIILIFALVILFLLFIDRGVITTPSQHNSTFITVNLAGTTTTTIPGNLPVLNLDDYKNSQEKIGIITFIEGIWPKEPLVGYAIIILLFILALPLITRIMDKVEKLL